MLSGMLKGILSNKMHSPSDETPKAVEQKKIAYNMGCGYNKLDGFINVDAFSECSPDLVADLEVLPWPFETSTADIVVFNHSLEHMGQDTKTFLGIMKELYRICKPGAEIQIAVPHPRHDSFMHDPTHVRVITPGLLTMFDKAENDDWKRRGLSNTPLAHYTGVNFKITETICVLTDAYHHMFENKEISEEDLEQRLAERNNIAQEYRVKMVAIKP